MVPTAGGGGQSCDDVCKTKGMTCNVEQLEFVNSCNGLLKVFPCENGCAHQVGKELPVYVHGSKEASHKQCLVTFISKLTCAGKHHATTRLCACMKSGK